MDNIECTHGVEVCKGLLHLEIHGDRRQVERWLTCLSGQPLALSPPALSSTGLLPPAWGGRLHFIHNSWQGCCSLRSSNSLSPGQGELMTRLTCRSGGRGVIRPAGLSDFIHENQVIGVMFMSGYTYTRGDAQSSSEGGGGCDRAGWLHSLEPNRAVVMNEVTHASLLSWWD